tara:strand:+ start:402 stop:587 length:186 start_codon:yes stop_codon:yes gene_type:complete
MTKLNLIKTVNNTILNQIKKQILKLNIEEKEQLEEHLKDSMIIRTEDEVKKWKQKILHQQE